MWLIRKTVSFFEKFYVKIFTGLNGFYFSKVDFRLLKEKKYDLIIAHHPNSIELASKLAKINKSKLVLNCHEYYPLEFDNNPVWMKYENPRIEKLLHQYQSKIALWLTVSNHIQKAYETNFLANCFLLYNSKRYQDITPHPVNSQNIRIIHHGAAMRERKLETMIACFMELPVNFSLTLMLMPNDSAYLAELKAKYSGVNNLFFTDVVPTNEIVSKIQRYDVGLFFLGDEIYNYKYCLPNKLFEFIQARLCVVVTPNPEMKDLVQKYKIGYVAESYSHEDCVKMLKGLTVEKEHTTDQKIASEIALCFNFTLSFSERASFFCFI
jgi:glycosyltransferase involved in cell wall biosynthesis